MCSYIYHKSHVDDVVRIYLETTVDEDWISFATDHSINVIYLERIQNMYRTTMNCIFCFIFQYNCIQLNNYNFWEHTSFYSDNVKITTALHMSSNKNIHNLAQKLYILLISFHEVDIETSMV